MILVLFKILMLVEIILLLIMLKWVLRERPLEGQWTWVVIGVGLIEVEKVRLREGIREGLMLVMLLQLEGRIVYRLLLAHQWIKLPLDFQDSNRQLLDWFLLKDLIYWNLIQLTRGNKLHPLFSSHDKPLIQ